MEHPGFFERAAPVRLDALAQKTGAQVAARRRSRPSHPRCEGLGRCRLPATSLSSTTASISSLLATTRASACLVAPAFAARVPEGTVALVMAQPYRGFALALQLLYPDAMRPESCDGGARAIRTSIPAPRLEEEVTVEPGAVVGREAQIGRGTTIAAGALIGYRVTIGRGFVRGARRLRHARPRRRPGRAACRASGWGRTASASPWEPRATSRCRRSAGSSSRTTSRSAPTAASTAARSRTR